MTNKTSRVDEKMTVGNLVSRLRAIDIRTFVRIRTGMPLISAEVLIGELCHEAATALELLDGHHNDAHRHEAAKVEQPGGGLPENFVVKHYVEDPYPTIKFDGGYIQVHGDREDAEDFLKAIYKTALRQPVAKEGRVPVCFRSEPNAQAQAENGCEDCKVMEQCFSMPLRQGCFEQNPASAGSGDASARKDEGAITSTDDSPASIPRETSEVVDWKLGSDRTMKMWNMFEDAGIKHSWPLVFHTLLPGPAQHIRLGYYDGVRNAFIESGMPDQEYRESVTCWYQFPMPPVAEAESEKS